MARLNSPDPRNANLIGSAVRMVAGQLVETDGSALGTWNFDVKIPAYAVILDIGVANEVVWGATAAVLDIGDYAIVTATGLIDADTAINADGFFMDLSLVSGGDIAAGAFSNFNHVVDASEGAYLAANLAPQTVTGDGIIALVDRWLRFSVLTTSAVGTAAGITYVYVIYALPEFDTATVTAT